MDNDKDKFLLSNIQKNNKKAFDALFRKYYPSLCQLAFLIVKSEEIAEEVVQEIFINIWEQRNRLKIKKSLRSYLFTATRNKALNYLSSEKKRLVYEKNALIEYSEEITGSGENNEELEMKLMLLNAVDNLPKKCKEIFKLSREEGMTYQEIADHLNISKKTVEAQMGIALKKLRAYLFDKF